MDGNKIKRRDGRNGVSDCYTSEAALATHSGRREVRDDRVATTFSGRWSVKYKMMVRVHLRLCFPFFVFLFLMTFLRVPATHTPPAATSLENRHRQIRLLNSNPPRLLIQLIIISLRDLPNFPNNHPFLYSTLKTYHTSKVSQLHLPPRFLTNFPSRHRWAR